MYKNKKLNMNRVFTLLVMVMMSKLGLSQFQFIDPSTGSQAGTSYTHYVDLNTIKYTVDFEVKNNYSSSKTVKVKRTLLSSVTGHDIYYCFGAVCLNPSPLTVYVPSQSATISANGGLPNGQGTYGLSADLDAMALGTSVVRYTLYDVNNPSDSIFVDLTYVVTPVGITELNVKNFHISQPSPNPALNNATFKYDFNFIPKEAQLKIYNMVGSLVQEEKITGKEGKISLDISGLEEGVYFCSLSVNDKIISTKRLIVSR